MDCWVPRPQSSLSEGLGWGTHALGMGNHTLRTAEFERLAGSITPPVSYLLFVFLPGLLSSLPSSQSR